MKDGSMWNYQDAGIAARHAFESLRLSGVSYD
jgi:hypothetical protein